MPKPSTYTITAALPYANGPIHIGHLAGVFLPADIYARYLRSRGRRVLFVSGSDEHGVPIMIRAQQEGTTPQKIVDRYHTMNKCALQSLGISFDTFGRTTDVSHYEFATRFFTRLSQRDKLVAKEEAHYYDLQHKQFLADRYVCGTCPHCGYNHAYGDQCESCGSALSPSELLHPRSTLSGATLRLRKTKHWYLPLNKHEAWLKQWLLAKHSIWKTNVYGQCKAWLDQGLQPRAVTRDLSWGIPVPLSEAAGKVLYVWFDAPLAYISMTQAWATKHGEDWSAFWTAPNTKIVHFIGKDNIVFHCIVFPAMLKAHGDIILPTYVPANEFLNLEGKKISTSRNWAVWLPDYLKEFPNQQDVLRYVLCRNAPENKDSDFRWTDFQAHNNSELVAILGNFVHRTFILIHKYCEGVVPERTQVTAVDQNLTVILRKLSLQVGEAIEHFMFREGLHLCMNVARAGNKYLTDTEPWHVVKKDRERAFTILNISLQVVGNLAILLNPFLPFTACRLSKMLNSTLLRENTWDRVGQLDIVPPQRILNKPILLFQPITDEQIAIQQGKLNK